MRETGAQSTQKEVRRMKIDFNTFVLLIISVQLALGYVKSSRK
ncbi:hypothetical protein [Geomonas oryzae]|nr:hypothetical protein [Geomonas oryzae]